MEVSYQWKDVVHQKKSPSCVVSTITSDNYISLVEKKITICNGTNIGPKWLATKIHHTKIWACQKNLALGWLEPKR